MGAWGGGCKHEGGGGDPVSTAMGGGTGSWLQKIGDNQHTRLPGEFKCDDALVAVEGGGGGAG
jgi:hypothetical protein